MAACWSRCAVLSTLCEHSTFGMCIMECPTAIDWMGILFRLVGIATYVTVEPDSWISITVMRLQVRALRLYLHFSSVGTPSMGTLTSLVNLLVQSGIMWISFEHRYFVGSADWILRSSSKAKINHTVYSKCNRGCSSTHLAISMLGLLWQCA